MKLSLLAQYGCLIAITEIIFSIISLIVLLRLPENISNEIAVLSPNIDFIGFNLNKHLLPILAQC